MVAEIHDTVAIAFSCQQNNKSISTNARSHALFAHSFGDPRRKLSGDAGTCKTGAGHCRILDANIGDAERGLQRVLPQLDPMMFPLWLVAHRELHTSRRIGVVFDFFSEELA
ncbi:MAG: hypothetical protein GY761_18685 [Hyphomicrobiales bacterium]|nr:hypothetical protein [Hyphomicrobiales bacterium]